MSHIDRAIAAITARDHVTDHDTAHARKGRTLCGIRAVRVGINVSCSLPILHTGPHRGAGIEWDRAGIETLVQGAA